MWVYLDRLGWEYQRNYGKLALQQRRDDARLPKLVNDAALHDKMSLEQGSEQVEGEKMLQDTGLFPYLNDFCNTETREPPPSEKPGKAPETTDRVKTGYDKAFNKGYEEARKQLEAKAGLPKEPAKSLPPPYVITGRLAGRGAERRGTRC